MWNSGWKERMSHGEGAEGLILQAGHTHVRAFLPRPPPPPSASHSDSLLSLPCPHPAAVRSRFAILEKQQLIALSTEVFCREAAKRV